MRWSIARQYILGPVTFVTYVMAHCKAIYFRPGDILNVCDGPMQGNIFLDSVTFVTYVMAQCKAIFLDPVTFVTYVMAHCKAIYFRPGDIRNVSDGPLQGNIL